MTYAQQAHRGFSNAILYVAAAAALVAAVTVGAAIGTGAVNLSIPASTGAEQAEPGPALLQAEQQWMLQRQQQSTFVDPVTRSAEQWMLQRQQQSTFVDPATRSAEQWMHQRRDLAPAVE